MELVIGNEYKLVHHFENLYGVCERGAILIYRGTKRSGTWTVYKFEAKSSGFPVSFIDYNGKVEEIMNGKNIKRGHFIVGSISKQTGALSFASQPKVHDYEGVAIAEAKRLAVGVPEKKFVVVEVKAIARTTDVVVD